MRIKHPLQTLQKSGSLCLTPPPRFYLCTHSLLPALTKRRRKTRKFNNAFERQDYLRRRLRCYAASEISCALLSVCSHHTPPSFHSSLPNLAKDSPQKAHQNSPLMPWQAINPSSPKLQIAGDVTHFGWVGWQVCMCLLRGVWDWGGWVLLFVCFKAGYFFNEVMPWQIWDNPFLSVWKVK